MLLPSLYFLKKEALFSEGFADVVSAGLYLAISSSLYSELSVVIKAVASVPLEVRAITMVVP